MRAGVCVLWVQRQAGVKPCKVSAQHLLRHQEKNWLSFGDLFGKRLGPTRKTKASSTILQRASAEDVCVRDPDQAIPLADDQTSNSALDGRWLN